MDARYTVVIKDADAEGRKVFFDDDDGQGIGLALKTALYNILHKVVEPDDIKVIHHGLE